MERLTTFEANRLVAWLLNFEHETRERVDLYDALERMRVECAHWTTMARYGETRRPLDGPAVYTVNVKAMPALENWSSAPTGLVELSADGQSVLAESAKRALEHGWPTDDPPAWFRDERDALLQTSLRLICAAA